MLTELTFEFTHFNPVIRLRKGKHSAFFRVSPVVSLLVEPLAAVPGFNLLFWILQLPDVETLLVLTLLKRQTAVNDL